LFEAGVYLGQLASGCFHLLFDLGSFEQEHPVELVWGQILGE